MRLQSTRLICAAPEVVWRLLIDTHAWPSWGPSVRAVESSSRYIEPGSTGRVLLAGVVWLPFEITEWEEGRFWGWRVAGIGATGHRVRPVDRAQCEVTFTMPAWAGLYRPVCSVALQRLAQLAGREGSS